MATVLKDPIITRPTAGSKSMRLGPSVYATRYVSVPPSHEPGDLLQHGYWKHISHLLRPLDIVRAVWEDGAGEMEVSIIKPEPGGAVVAERIPFIAYRDKGDAEVADDYEIKWAGPHSKFVVIRLSDGKRLREGLHPRAAALAALAEVRSAR